MRISHLFLLLMVGSLAWGGSALAEEKKAEGGHEAAPAHEAKAEGEGKGEGKAGASGDASSTLPEEAPQVKQGRVFTETETQLLLELDKQRIELDRRAQAIELREKLVDLMQQKLNQRVAELNQLKADLEKLLVSVSGRDDKELNQLATLYANMKPATAAPVLNKLENLVVVDILSRMPVKKSGKLLDAMDPIKVRAISEIMASRTTPPQVKPAATAPATPAGK